MLMVNPQKRFSALAVMNHAWMKIPNTSCSSNQNVSPLIGLMSTQEGGNIQQQVFEEV